MGGVCGKKTIQPADEGVTDASQDHVHVTMRSRNLDEEEQSASPNQPPAKQEESAYRSSKLEIGSIASTEFTFARSASLATRQGVRGGKREAT